jgi:hypothetical protein
MLNRRLIAHLLLLLLLAGGSTLAGAAQISRSKINAYLENALEKYASDTSTDWQDRMYRLLAAKRDPEAVARSLAVEDGLSVGDEQSLIALWIEYASLRDAEEADTSNRSKVESSLRALEGRAIGAVRVSRYNAIAIQVATDILSEVRGCRSDSLEALITGAPSVLSAGIFAADKADCGVWWLALHARFPDNAAILAELSRRKYDLRLSERLALLEQLNARQDVTREARISLKFEYASMLWRAGLVLDGLRVIDAMPDSDRQLMFGDTPLPDRTVLDGIPAHVHAQDSGERIDFTLDYIAALYLADRSEEARKVLDGVPFTAVLRALWDCLGDPITARVNDSAERCRAIDTDLTWRLWLLESVLNRSDEDPYVLAETGLSGLFAMNQTLDHESALWIEVTRRRMTGSNYEGLRRSLTESWGRQARYRGESGTSAQSRLGDDLRRTASAYDDKIRAFTAQWGVTVSPQVSRADRPRATPPPLPSGFRERSLRENLRTKRGGKEQEPEDWPKDVTRLPEGFYPVRLEVRATVAVAVSLSQALDPVGEVSQGGYWIHVSRDSGATWGLPLYTGLSEYFPYVVMTKSKMPILAGDRINLEVEVQEIDPSTITYPPVALRSRRRVSNLYLEIPIASLESDRDRDGLTDIIEDRLLLNPDMSDSDGDGLADGRDPLPNVKSTGAQPSGGDPITRILQFVFHTPSEALIEPVDRDPDSIGQWKSAGLPNYFRPLLVHGSPEDFKMGLNGAQMLVYSDADVEKLRSRSPDFHALSLGPVVFNRAGDRGYAVWSMGWTGGSLRLIRERGAWTIALISQWVT